MDNDKKQNPEDIETQAAQEGRNSNDDFNEGAVDDYGVDKTQPGAAEEIQKRSDIKSGTGTQGAKRNPNDNFAEE
ncbi:hypothetical protein [Persicitalea jodogahamensis]|uniref:Uncharacterized protein n=1 Tax=Persicitalea jodogahamensis TaxID=402147 RepID=A0A8J3G7E2_9BACT|nr:hypothetical protein [Persicitalea jodogahamensis]GHB54462.1 hypothetical protein GCM10007390_04350 [Persicitalea jodogahamensis]